MPAHFGLDVSSSSIKIIETKKSGNRYLLKAFGEVPIPAQLNSEIQKDQILIAEAIKKLAQEAKVSTKNVIVALPESQIYSRVVSLPSLTLRELETAIKFEAEQYVPIPLDQVSIEHIVLKTPQKGSDDMRMEVLLIAAQKKAVLRFERIMNLAGLTPLALETELLAILRSVSFQLNGSGVIIDIGQDTTNLAMIVDDSLKQVNTINSGGGSLTRAIATNLSLSMSQAERYKRIYGLENSQLEGKVAGAMLDVLGVVVGQIKRSLAFMRQKYPDSPIQTAILTGGSSLMPDLPAYLAGQLGLEVLLGDPFYQFVRDQKFPEPLLQVAPRFATAVGLSIREN